MAKRRLVYLGEVGPTQVSPGDDDFDINSIKILGYLDMDDNEIANWAGGPSWRVVPDGVEKVIGEYSTHVVDEVAIEEGGSVAIEEGGRIMIVPGTMAGDDITKNIQTIYVDGATGSDTGNGTQGDPFKTLTMALGKIPRIIRHEIIVKVAAGTYSSFPRKVVHEYFEDGKLVIDGTGANYTTIAGPFTISSITDRGSYQGFPVMTEFEASGQSWTANQYRYKYIHFLTGSAAGVLYPIRTSTADTLYSFGNRHSIGIGDTFEIVEPSVVIEVDHSIHFQGNGVSTPASWGNDAPSASHLGLGGLIFKVPGSNEIQFQDLKMLTTFVSVIRTVEDGSVNILDVGLNSDFAQDFPKFDNAGSQSAVDIFFARCFVIGTDYASPGADHRQFHVYNSNIVGICGAHNVMVWAGDNNLSKILIGGIECYRDCSLDLFHVYCSIVGYRALNFLQASVGIGGIYIGATTYLDFAQGMTVTLDSLTGDSSSISDDYAVHVSRFTGLWLPAPSNVTIAGQVGAYEFENGNQGTYVSWPTTGTDETDDAGSHVIA